MSDWKPDKDIVEFILQYLKDATESDWIIDERRMLTWAELREEVNRGTPFGRGCYATWEAVLTRGVAMQRVFEEWKKNRKLPE